MNDRFFSLQVFTRVARSGSFSRAARELGLTQPSVSRIVRALERQVGVELLTRSTRAVKLTEPGGDYLARGEAILAALDEADHAARGTGELRGVLRVAASHSFAQRTLIPRISRFTDQHPKLRVEFLVGDAPHDLIGESVDVAVRIGALNDSALKARKIGTVQRALVASPDYLLRAGEPRRPEDLSKHTLIIGPAGMDSQGWSFRKNERTVTLAVEGRFVINAAEAATAAAASGLGILSTGLGAVGAELDSGRLRRLLPDWDMDASDIHVLLPAGRAAKPSARAFANFVTAHMVETEPPSSRPSR